MTFTTIPVSTASVNSPLIWVTYDANAIDVTKLDYKYVAEVWIDGVKVHTERAYPRPVGSFGIFDFAGVIRNYIAPFFKPNLAVPYEEYQQGVFRTPSVQIKMREEYNGTVGTIVLTSTAALFFNTYSERPELTNPLLAYADKFATSRPNKISLLANTTAYFIPYYKTTATPDVILAVAGVSFNALTVLTSTVNNSCLLINASPLLYPSAIGSGTEYTVSINSETYNVNIICSGLYGNYMVHFLNRFGSFDSMLFNKVSKRRKQFERKDYKQQPYRVDASGVVSFTNGAYRHEQRTQYAVKIEEKVRLQTDLLTDDEYKWLSQLVASPMVIVEDAGVFYPVIITDSNYEYKEHIVDGLTTLSIEVDFTGSTNTQYR